MVDSVETVDKENIYDKKGKLGRKEEESGLECVEVERDSDECPNRNI